MRNHKLMASNLGRRPLATQNPQPLMLTYNGAETQHFWTNAPNRSIQSQLSVRQNGHFGGFHPIRKVEPGRDPAGLKHSIDFLRYGGAKLVIRQPDGDNLSDVKVHLNPGNILHDHNGSNMELYGVLDALTVYLTHARYLLEDPDDWPDLLPGLREDSPAYWKMLEIPFHCEDPDGQILAALRHLEHPRLRTLSRHWPDSIELGTKKSLIQFSIYPKELLDKSANILRLEVRLRDDKLVEYLGNGDNVSVIDGKERLVRFFPDQLTMALTTSFGELRNVWQRDVSLHDTEAREAKRKELEPLGVLIARTARDPRNSQAYPALIKAVKQYCGANPKSDTMRRIRKAGSREMERLSNLRFDEVFSEAALRSQPGIAVKSIECMVKYSCDELRYEPLLLAAYLPPGVEHSDHYFLRSYIN